MAFKPGTPIPPKVKERVAELVGKNLSYPEVARACEMSETSVERIMHDPSYRQIADDIVRKSTSMSTQVSEVVRSLLEATKDNGDPDMALRQRGAELFAKAPELLDIADGDVTDTMLPGVILRFPNAAIPDPEAPVEFTEDMLAPVHVDPEPDAEAV